MDRPPFVLLVEDDPLVLRSLTRHLRSRGLSCTAVHSVEEALRSKEIFSAAIIDINLPDGCGLSLFEQLQARGQSLVPIFFSATADADEVARAEALGQFVPKSAGPLRAVDCVLSALPAEATNRSEPPPRSMQRSSRRATNAVGPLASESPAQGADATKTVKTKTR